MARRLREREEICPDYRGDATKPAGTLPVHGTALAQRRCSPPRKTSGDQSMICRRPHSLQRGTDGQKNKALTKSEPYLYSFTTLEPTGGEGGIRTHGTGNRTPDFESGTFDHSATSPVNFGRFTAWCSEDSDYSRTIFRVELFFKKYSKNLSPRHCISRRTD